MCKGEEGKEQKQEVTARETRRGNFQNKSEKKIQKHNKEERRKVN